MAENALAVTGPDWKAMTHEHRGPVLADYIDGFRRHTLVEFWIIGRGLEIRRRGMNQGDWYAYLDSINMRPAMASELRRLARGYPTIEELQRHATKDAAIKALKALPPATPPAPTVQEPTAEIQRSTGPDREQEPAEPGESRTTRENVPVHVPAPEPEPEADPKAVIDAVAAEVELTPAELRDQRLERLAIMTEDIDGDVVEAWADKLDKADARHREDVATINAEQRKRAAAERALRDMTDALLSEPGCPCCDGVLATFRGVARMVAA